MSKWKTFIDELCDEALIKQADSYAAAVKDEAYADAAIREEQVDSELMEAARLLEKQARVIVAQRAELSRLKSKQK